MNTNVGDNSVMPNLLCIKHSTPKMLEDSTAHKEKSCGNEGDRLF